MAGHLFQIVLLVALGAAFFGGAYGANVNRRRFQTEGVETEAEVIAMSSDGEGGPRTPTVRFVTVAGTSVECEPTSIVRGSSYIVGQRVSIRYLPNDPRKTALGAGADGFTPVLVFVALGVGCIIGAALTAFGVVPGLPAFAPHV